MKTYFQFLDEIKVLGALKTGGIRGAVRAVKHNIQQRGVIGGTGLGDNSIAGGGAHSGVHSRIGREAKTGKLSGAEGARQQARVQRHYEDKTNAENKRLGVAPAFPRRGER